MKDIFATSARSLGWFLHARPWSDSEWRREDGSDSENGGREEEEAAVPFYVVAAVFSIPFHIT